MCTSTTRRVRRVVDELRGPEVGTAMTGWLETAEPVAVPARSRLAAHCDGSQDWVRERHARSFRRRRRTPTGPDPGGEIRSAPISRPLASRAWPANGEAVNSHATLDESTLTVGVPGNATFAAPSPR